MHKFTWHINECSIFHLYPSAIPKGSHKQIFVWKPPTLKHFCYQVFQMRGSQTIDRLKGGKRADADGSQEKMELSPEIIIEGIMAGTVWNFWLHSAPSGHTAKSADAEIEGFSLINQPIRRLDLGHLRSKGKAWDKNPKVIWHDRNTIASQV